MQERVVARCVNCDFVGGSVFAQESEVCACLDPLGELGRIVWWCIDLADRLDELPVLEVVHCTSIRPSRRAWWVQIQGPYQRADRRKLNLWTGWPFGASEGVALTNEIGSASTYWALTKLETSAESHAILI